jgi:GntR family transcriptional repressor for pyruvate dehydrogenase complex
MFGCAAMQFEPISRKRTTEIVIENLEERILDGTFGDGDKLPSEELLATQLGVGRRSIREALKVLEAKGLIEVQMGVGATVKRNDLDNFLDALTRNMRAYLSINKADLKHVMELRRLLEGTALEQLAENPDKNKLNELTDAIQHQHEAFEESDFLKYQEWHFHFHNGIIDVLDNPVISMIYRQVLTLMRTPMEKSGSHPEISARAIGDHEQMIEALRRGSVVDAQKVLDRHLTNFISDLTENI